jgi:hypothetical protein
LAWGAAPDRNLARRPAVARDGGEDPGAARDRRARGMAGDAARAEVFACLARSRCPPGCQSTHPLPSLPHTTTAVRADAPTTRPTVFQNPAVGFPNRSESTRERRRARRQESHSTARQAGTPETESDPTATACQRSNRPSCQTWTCWRGGMLAVGGSTRCQPAPQLKDARPESSGAAPRTDQCLMPDRAIESSALRRGTGRPPEPRLALSRKPGSPSAGTAGGRARSRP